MTLVFLNGRFFGGPDDPPIADARIGAFDAGIQHAVGLFETMTGGSVTRGIEGPRSHGEEHEAWVLQLDEHLDRLARSARALGLSDRLKTSALAHAVLETVVRARLPKARVRLTITGGDLSLLAAARARTAAPETDPTIMIAVQPATAYPPELFQRGARLALADARANPLQPFEGHKTLNYWWRLRELQQAAARGADEALILSVTNHLAGGCVSNLVLIKDDRLITPIARGEEPGAPAEPEPQSDDPTLPPFAPAPGKPAKPPGAPAIASPVLPGVTRRWLIDRADRMGLRIEKRLVTLQDLLDADEAMLTNSSWGVLPVTALEGSPIGPAARRGAVGPFALDFRQAWLELWPDAASD